MKKIYFLAFSLVSIAFSNAQIINDDFESYPVGPYFGGHWSNWDGVSGVANLLITDSHAASGTKAGAINTDGQDVLLMLDPVFEGVYTLEWKMFIPSDKSAWIGTMEDTSNPGDSNQPVTLNWNIFGVQDNGDDLANLLLIAESDGTNNTLVAAVDYPKDEWVTYDLVFDLDNMSYGLFINNTSVRTGLYQSALFQFSGIDMWKYADNENFGLPGTGLPCEWYIDDVVFRDGGMSVNDIGNSNISIYPTLVKDSFTVSAKSSITEISVVNMEGKQVLSLKPNKNIVQVNTTSLPAGVYVVKTISGKEVKSTKVVVK